MLSAIIQISVGVAALIFVFLRRLFIKGNRFTLLLQGLFGVSAFLWGVLSILYLYRHLNWLNKQSFWWILSMGMSFLTVLTGFIFGFKTVYCFVLGNKEETAAKKDNLTGKLMIYQILLGSACIGLGSWAVIYRTFF